MKRFLLYSFLTIATGCLFSNGASVPPNTEPPMLERKLAHPDSTVYVPYSTLCLVSGAELPDDYSGWLLESKIQKSISKSLLVIEMDCMVDADYSAGALQLVVEVPDFKNSFQFAIRSNKVKVHLINNYGGPGTERDSLEGQLSLTKINGQIQLDGRIGIYTIKAFTKQVAAFENDLIPIHTLDEFLAVTQKKDAEFETAKDAMIESIVNKIMSDTIGPDTEMEAEPTAPGQSFKLIYSVDGLGSNRGYPSRILVRIEDNVLHYGMMEESKTEITDISYSTGDTTWKDVRVWYSIPFAAASRDSILVLLKEVQGKAVFQTNPHVMSGAIYNLYLEYSGWCTSFTLKNAANPIFNSITKIINPYLPEDYQLFDGPDPNFKFDFYKDQLDPSLSECTGMKRKNYAEILSDEFESLQNTRK